MAESAVSPRAQSDKKRSQQPAKPRFALALYDFLGSREQRTLTVFKGDIIRIKEVTESQWWLGECNGVLGFVPRTYVCLKEPDWKPDWELLGDSAVGGSEQAEDEEKEGKDDDLTDDEDYEEDGAKAYTVPVVALYNFEKSDPRHLAFKKHDKFFVVELLTPDQPWLEGKFNGEEGLVPANRVYILKPGETEAPKKNKKTENKDDEKGGETKITEPLSPRKKVFMKAIALRDYQSKNGDLSFTRGDVLEVETSGSSDWWPARYNGKQGIIPKQFVRLLDASSSNEVKKEMLFSHITGNQPPSRSTPFGRRDIRDIPFFAALFALRGGLPPDADVEEGFAVFDERLLGNRDSVREAENEPQEQPVLGKPSNRLTDIVSAVRATREAVSRELSEDAGSNASGGTPLKGDDKVAKAKKKSTMTAVVSKNATLRRSEYNKPINDTEVSTVEKYLRFHFVSEGTILFHEGSEEDNARALFIVLEGELEVKVGNQGLGTLTQGHFFGLDALVRDTSKRQYTVAGKARQTILVSISLMSHRALCKALNWYEEAIHSLYKSQSGSALQRLAIFHKVDQYILDLIGLRFTLRKIKKGQGVYEPDDDLPPEVAQTSLEEGLYIVLSGVLSVTVKLGDGTKREIRRMGPGQYFGESALIGSDAGSVASASALVPSMVMYFSKSDLFLVEKLDPRLRSEIERVSRYRTTEVLRSIPFMTVVPSQKQDVLAAAFEYVIKRDGEEFYEHARNQCMYLVCEGEVEMVDDTGDVSKTLRLGNWFGEKALTQSSDQNRPAGKSEAGEALESANSDTPIAHGSVPVLCLAISNDSFQRFLDVVPEIKAQIKENVQSMVAQQDGSSGLHLLKNMVPTSADELACVTQLPAEFLSSDREARAALDSWAEIGKIMAPCLKALQGYPQYLHPVPFDFGGRDPQRKFIVTIVKLDRRMESIKLPTSASETVGQLVDHIFERFQHAAGVPLDPAGSSMFALKVASRADYLLERSVELGRYKCVTAALRRELVHGELKFALVDLRSNPRQGPGLRLATKRNDHESVAESTLMEAIALYDHDGGPGGLAFRAGDRLEVEPRIGEAYWPAVLPNGAAGMVPQNFIKAIAPIIGPTRGGPIQRRLFGPQLPSAKGASPGSLNDNQQNLSALPPLMLDEWAKTINDGFAKVEKIPPNWGKLSAKETMKTTQLQSIGSFRGPNGAPPTAPWPLRLRLRGFERLFAIPGIERCGFLQARVELVFGGEVLEKKLSKPVKRNSVLRFEDEWFYFSKFAADMSVSTRIVITLVGLDVSPDKGADKKDVGRSVSFDDLAEESASVVRADAASTITHEMVRRMDSSSTLNAANKESNLSRFATFFRGKKQSMTTSRLRTAASSVSTTQGEVTAVKITVDGTNNGATVPDAIGEAGSKKTTELELAGVAFYLWNADLTLRGGVHSFGLWTGQAGDRILYCIENYEHDPARVIVELDKFAEPVYYNMPAPVQPSTDGPASNPQKTATRQVAKPEPVKKTSDAKSGKANDDRQRKNRRMSVSVYVARQNPDGTMAHGGGAAEKPQVSKMVKELLSRDPLQIYQMTDTEKGYLWAERELLIKDPFALSKVMLAVNWNSPVQREQALQILGRWAVPAPMQALELLDSRFGDYRLREYAVRCLDEFDDEELADFLLQLIQVLKFEPFHDSPLARFLFRRALANPREIGNKLFWGLRAEMHLKKFAPRFGLLLKAYLRACGAHFAELAQQHDVQELLKSVAKADSKLPKSTPKAERNANARRAIMQINEQMPRLFELPLDPRMRALRFNPDACRIMSSKKRPLWMALESVDPPECGGENMHVMFKAGDDLRQDQMTLQIIRVLEQIWLAEGMNMKLTPYGCISTGDELGMLEIVPDSETIAHIETTQGGTFGSLKDTPIRKFLEHHNKGSVDQAIDNFVRSCAGYCVATYIMGIGDRHNDNILCCRDGRLLHIDFGHFLGNFKTVAALGGFKRERTPFVLTKGMAYAMGGKGTEEFTRFVDLCCKAFNIIRAHGDELVTMFRLMVPAGMPELKSDEDIQYLVEQLHLGKTDEEANRIFQGEINAAIGDFYRRVDNFLHTIKHS